MGQRQVLSDKCRIVMRPSFGRSTSRSGFGSGNGRGRGMDSARDMGRRAVAPAVGMEGAWGRCVPTRGSRGARGVLRGWVARPARLRRCTLPITALRVTPMPRRAAIWLALRPSAQNFLSDSTRSSVHGILSTVALCTICSFTVRIPHMPQTADAAGVRFLTHDTETLLPVAGTHSLQWLLDTQQGIGSIQDAFSPETVWLRGS